MKYALPFIILILLSAVSAGGGRIVSASGSSVQITDEILLTEKFGEPLFPIKKGDWKAYGKGISAAEITLERNDSSSSLIRIVKFDKALFSFSMLGEEGRGKPADVWVSEAKHIAGINANYYFYRENGSPNKIPLGLIIKEGKQLYTWKENYSGCFYYDGKKAGILYKEKPPAGSIMACQSFPVVIYDGIIPEGVREKSGVKLDVQKRSRRSVIAEDRKGDIYFLISVQNMSFQELGVVCGLTGLSKALCLDGGSSTQFCIMDSDTIIMSGLERVPFVIGVRRK
ncbi:MAG: phosphodiester glycosidase family protein [Fibrobacteres bacterium]|nr:phosphodiester glycosidase family protein [Fibrobacterota bacterium]